MTVFLQLFLKNLSSLTFPNDISFQIWLQTWVKNAKKNSSFSL